MITVTDAKQISEEISRCPIGTTLDVRLIGFGGGDGGTMTLSRANELERWTYAGPLKIPQQTHARELSKYRVNPISGLTALRDAVRRDLRGEVRTVVLRNPMPVGSEVVFDAQLVFETRFYVLCHPRGSHYLQLHAGPYRLNLDEQDVSSLVVADREARREALLKIMTDNLEPTFGMDEILRAGGSTETYNLDQLQLAMQTHPLIFDEDAARYLSP